MLTFAQLILYLLVRPLQLLLWSPIRHIAYAYIRRYNKIPKRIHEAKRLAANKETSLDIYDPVLELSAMELARRIRAGELSSVEIVTKYIERIKKVNPFINAMIANRFNLAISEAQEVDKIICSGNIPDEYSVEKRPFLGVPVTIKESIAVEGMPNTYGLTWRLNAKYNPASENSERVNNLVDAGFIVLGVTNIPELLMAWESDSTIYGRSFNPYDLRLNTGGSSSGEGAILGAGASVIGLGTDIGGSIRMPAFFCGVFGHKVTSDWIPKEPPNFLSPTTVGKAACATSGPLCRYAEDLAPFVSVLIGRNIGDPRAIKMRDLRVVVMPDGYGYNLFISNLDTELRQSIVNAADYLAQSVVGPENVVFVKPPSDIAQTIIAYPTMIGAGESSSAVRIGGEGHPPLSVFKEIIPFLCGKSPYTGNSIFTVLRESILPGKDSRDPIMPYLNKTRAYFEDLMGDNGVLLFPPHPTVAQPHGISYFNLLNFIYTGIFNILGLPVTQVPLGLNKDGIPLGVQVVARHGEDLKAIAVAITLEEKFGGWIPPRRFGAPLK